VVATELEAAASREAVLRARLATVRRQLSARGQDLRALVGSSQPVEVRVAALPAAELPALTRIDSPAETLERRPDVFRARRGVDAALLRLGAADAGRYPRLVFSAGLQRGTGGMADWITQSLATLVSTLSLPLFEWSRIELRRQAARTDLEAATASLRDTLVTAAAEIESLAAQRRELSGHLATQRQLVHDAKRAEAIARSQWKEGALSRRDWLLALSALESARADDQLVQLSAWQTHIQLLRAISTL
jgi:outer membrane protein TolC